MSNPVWVLHVRNPLVQVDVLKEAADVTRITFAPFVFLLI